MEIETYEPIESTFEEWIAALVEYLGTCAEVDE